jgi:hypothetical protein
MATSLPYQTDAIDAAAWLRGDFDWRVLKVTPGWAWPGRSGALQAMLIRNAD